jgi:cysteine-rich repeat protein
MRAIILAASMLSGCFYLSGFFRPLCGDQLQELDEECDDGNTLDGDGCDTECSLEFCGNGIVQASEECDDGNKIDDDECTNDCQAIPVNCGDGIAQPPEECDDGNTLNNDACSSSCQLEFCGDGVVQTSEQCDDSNISNGDGCDAVCQVEIPATCGNALVDINEECDDGNNINNDGCEANCQFICGPANSGAFRATLFNNNCYLGFTTDEITWQDAETSCEALDGYLAVIDSINENTLVRSMLPTGLGPWIGFNDIQSEAGSNATLFVKVTGGTIANGFINFGIGEPNNTGGDGEDCVHMSQGNAAGTWADVTCTTLPNPFASGFVCEIEPIPCGDGVTQSSEECDDGNNVSGDGCSATCFIE